MIRYSNISNLVVLLLLWTGCKEQLVDISNFNQEDGIALVGEINQMDTVIVALVKTGNLITGKAIESIDNATISLLNKDNETISDFSFNPYEKWNANLLPVIQPGDEYTIHAKVNDVELSATTQIPLPVIVRMVNTEKIENNIYLDIEIENPNKLDAFCSVELFSYSAESVDDYENNSSQVYTNIPLYTRDIETDNIKYNELTAPYSKIFIPIKKMNKKALRINIDDININDFNTNYCLWIKSLESNYYQFMYNNELQKSQHLDDVSFRVQLIDNIENGIGFCGGCYKVERPVIFFRN